MSKGNENELGNLNAQTDSNESEVSVELGDYSQLLTENKEPTVSEKSETVGFENEKYSVNSDDTGFGTDEDEDNVFSINNTEEANFSRSMNNNKKPKKKLIFILIFLMLICLGIFVLVKKPFVKESTTVTSISLNSTEEKQVQDVVQTIASFYEDGGKRTVLKTNIDMKKVEELKKTIDGTSNKVAKEEFIRLYEELVQDIATQKNTNSTNYEEILTSTGS